MKALLTAIKRVITQEKNSSLSKLFNLWNFSEVAPKSKKSMMLGEKIITTAVVENGDLILNGDSISAYIVFKCIVGDSNGCIAGDYYLLLVNVCWLYY